MGDALDQLGQRQHGLVLTRQLLALEVISERDLDLEGIVHHRHLLLPGERAVKDFIPVTTAERTLFDLAGSMPAVELGRICDLGLRRKEISLSRLEHLVESHRGSGRRRLDPILAVLADRVPGYNPGANVWEAHMDRMWDEMRLPPAVRQYRLIIGRHTFWPDRAIIDLQIAVEWNGYEAHGNRSAFDRDSWRRAHFASAGWYYLGFTSRIDPKLICRAVLAVVEERRQLFGLTG